MSISNKFSVSIFKKINAISLLISLFIIVTPFLVYYYGKSPYEFPKFIFSLIIAQILAVVLLLQKTAIKKNRLILFITLFVLVSFVADMLGLDPRVSLIGSEFRFQGLLLLISGFIFALSTSTIINKNILQKAIIFSSLILSLITLYQFSMLKFGHFIPTYNGRVVATLGNPNFIGAYLAVALPFLLFLDLKNKILKILLSAIVIGSVFISGSLSAIFAVFVILIFFLLKVTNQKKIKALFIFLLILTGLATFLLGKSSIYRYSQWDNRFIIWNAGINSVIQKPILGVGQENFELIFPKNMHFRVDNAHNLFLETAVSSGLIGLFLYLLIICNSLKLAEFKIKLAIIAFLITGFFNPLNIVSIILFWILVGFSIKKS